MENVTEMLIFRAFLVGIVMGLVTILVLIAKYRSFLKGIFQFFRAITNNIDEKNRNDPTKTFKDELQEIYERALIEPPGYCKDRKIACDMEFTKMLNSLEKIKNLDDRLKEKLSKTDDMFLAKIETINKKLQQPEWFNSMEEWVKGMNVFKEDIDSKWGALIMGLGVISNYIMRKCEKEGEPIFLPKKSKEVMGLD